MNQKTLDLENNLIHQLRIAQDNVIGMFKPRGSDIWECVIDDDEGYLTCIHVGNLLGLSTDHIMQAQGTYRKFPEKKTLSQMMNDPFGFHAWYENNCK